ncbi:MAG TPA: DedA family protein [Candidatus Acidoferrales bacterium]|nr:DedA family protein [Candidatus Acidoferrales bacterium]
MEHLQQAIVALIDHYGYLGLFVGLALGNIGLPVGTELLLPLAGALTATGHLSNLWLTILVALVGELAGGSVGYAIGRFGGVPLIERYGKYVHFTHARLMQVHAFFDRWGTFAIFVCRFLPVLRGIVAIPAGIAEMNLALFYLWTFLGSLIFCTFLILLGGALGAHIDTVLPLLRRGGYIVLGVAVLAVVATIFVMRKRASAASG